MKNHVQRIPAMPFSNDSPTINTRQLCFFAAFVVPVSKLLETPSLLSSYALGDLIFPAFLQFLLQSIPLAALLFLSSKAEEGLFALIEEKLGRIGSKILYAALALYYIFSTLLPLLDLEKFSQAAFFDTAPTAFNFTPFFFLSGFICAKGLKSFSRVTDLCFPIFLIAFFGLIFMSAGKADYQSILPWFEFPLPKIGNAVRNTTAHFSDAILFLPLLGNYRHEKGATKKVLGSFWLGACFTLLFLATFYGIYTSLAPRQHYAFTKTAQYFPALKTVGRIDLLLVYLLTVVLLYYHTLPLQCATTLIAKTVNVEQKTLISLLLNGSLFAFTFFCNKYYNFFSQLLTQTLWWIFPVFSVLLPLLCLLLLIGKTRKKKGGKVARKKKEVAYAR